MSTLNGRFWRGRDDGGGAMVARRPRVVTVDGLNRQGLLVLPPVQALGGPEGCRAQRQVGHSEHRRGVRHQIGALSAVAWNAHSLHAFWVLASFKHLATQRLQNCATVAW